MIAVIHATYVGNLTGAHIGKAKQFLGPGDAELGEVGRNAFTIVLFKFPAKIILAHVEFFRQFFKGTWMHIILLKVCLDFSQFLLRGNVQKRLFPLLLADNDFCQ